METKWNDNVSKILSSVLGTWEAQLMVVGAGGCWAFIIFVVDYRGGSQGSSFPTYLDSGEAQVVVNVWTQAGRQRMYLPWWVL